MKRKFNWVDVTIIIVLVVMIGFGYRFISNRKVVSIQTTPVEVTIRVDGVQMETVNVINVGDTFKDKETNQVFGKVIDKEVTDAFGIIETGDGRLVKSKLPNKYTVYMTLSGDALITDDYIKLGNRDVRLEGTIFLKSNISAIKTKVVAIKIPE